jgi:ketosteroid isomerase-like protein
MSQENVDVVRRGYEAFDSDELELPLEAWDPDCEFMPAMAGAVEAKIYRRYEGMRRYFDELYESFSSVRIEDRDYRDLGERVLVLYRLRVRGRDSGVTSREHSC